MRRCIFFVVNPLDCMSPEDQARLTVDVGYANIGPALSCCVKCVECDVGEEASRRCRIRWQPPIRKVARAKALTAEPH